MATVYTWAASVCTAYDETAWQKYGVGVRWELVRTNNPTSQHIYRRTDNSRGYTCGVDTMPATNGGPVTKSGHYIISKRTGPCSGRSAWWVNSTYYLSNAFAIGTSYTQLNKIPETAPGMTEANINAGEFGVKTHTDGSSGVYWRVDRILPYWTYTPASGVTETCAWLAPFMGALISVDQWMWLVNFARDVQVGHRKRPSLGMPGSKWGNIFYDPWEIEDLAQGFRNLRRAYSYAG